MTKFLQLGAKFVVEWDTWMGLVAFSADPGSFSSYSSPLSEIDGSVNTECPYPPCRQLGRFNFRGKSETAQLVKED